MNTGEWVTILLFFLSAIQAGVGGTLIYILNRQGKTDERIREGEKERGNLFGKISMLETRILDQREHTNDVLSRIEAKVDKVALWIEQKDRDIQDFYRKEAGK